MTTHQPVTLRDFLDALADRGLSPTGRTLADRRPADPVEKACAEIQARLQGGDADQAELIQESLADPDFPVRQTSNAEEDAEVARMMLTVLSDPIAVKDPLEGVAVLAREVVRTLNSPLTEEETLDVVDSSARSRIEDLEGTLEATIEKIGELHGEVFLLKDTEPTVSRRVASRRISELEESLAQERELTANNTRSITKAIERVGLLCKQRLDSLSGMNADTVLKVGELEAKVNALDARVMDVERDMKSLETVTANDSEIKNRRIRALNVDQAKLEASRSLDPAEVRGAVNDHAERLIEVNDKATDAESLAASAHVRLDGVVPTVKRFVEHRAGILERVAKLEASVSHIEYPPAFVPKDEAPPAFLREAPEVVNLFGVTPTSRNDPRYIEALRIVRSVHHRELPAAAKEIDRLNADAERREADAERAENISAFLNRKVAGETEPNLLLDPDYVETLEALRIESERQHVERDMPEEVVTGILDSEGMLPPLRTVIGDDDVGWVE